MSIYSSINIPNIHQDARFLFLSLCNLPISPKEHIVEKLHKHTEKMREESKTNSILDLKTAELIDKTLTTLVNDYPTLSETEMHFLQAAVMYYIIDGDAISDTQSPNGFDDDAIVAQAVLEAVASREYAE